MEPGAGPGFLRDPEGETQPCAAPGGLRSLVDRLRCVCVCLGEAPGSARSRGWVTCGHLQAMMLLAARPQRARAQPGRVLQRKYCLWRWEERPARVLAPGLLPGRCLPGSDWARNLLSVLRDGEAGETLAPSALSTATAFCGGWTWGQPTRGATPPSRSGVASSYRKPLLTTLVQKNTFP